MPAAARSVRAVKRDGFLKRRARQVQRLVLRQAHQNFHHGSKLSASPACSYRSASLTASKNNQSLITAPPVGFGCAPHTTMTTCATGFT